MTGASPMRWRFAAAEERLAGDKCGDNCIKRVVVART